MSNRMTFTTSTIVLILYFYHLLLGVSAGGRYRGGSHEGSRYKDRDYRQPLHDSAVRTTSNAAGHSDKHEASTTGKKKEHNLIDGSSHRSSSTISKKMEKSYSAAKKKSVRGSKDEQQVHDDKKSVRSPMAKKDGKQDRAPVGSVRNSTGGRDIRERATRFNIDIVNFSNNTDYDHLFEMAAMRWEEIITTDTLSGVDNYADFDLFNGTFNEPYMGPVDDLVIGYQILTDEFFPTPEKLGGSSPTASFSLDPDRLTPPIFPIAGILLLNRDALARYNYSETDVYIVILHEIGHLLGIGTLWSQFCASGCLATLDDDGNFTLSSDGYYCARAQVAYNNMFLDVAVPDVDDVGKRPQLLVNQVGGLGDVCSHWAEESFNISGLSSELMTSFVEQGIAQPLSAVTIGALEDLGYIVDYSKADKFPTRSENHSQRSRRRVRGLQTNACDSDKDRSSPPYPDNTFSILDIIDHPLPRRLLETLQIVSLQELR